MSKKYAATHWIWGIPTSSLKSVPAMTEPFSSQPFCPSELARQQKYPVRLMQHQENPAQLGQHINQIILNSSDSEILLLQIAQALGEAFRVDCCLVTVTHNNQPTNRSAYWYSDTFPAPMPEHQQVTLLQLQSFMQSSSEPLLVDDVQAHETSQGTEWRHLGLPVRAVLAIPTKFQGKICGAIVLIRSQPYHWSESEKECAQAVAAPVAIALTQILQTQAIASLQQQVDTSAQYQTLINRLMMASRSSLELNQILRLAISGTAAALQVDRGLILLLKYADPLFKSRETREHIPKAKATVVCEWPSDYEPGIQDRSNAGSSADDNASTLLNQSFWLSECLLCQQALTNSPKPVLIASQYDLSAINQSDVAPLFNLERLPALLLLPLESQGTVLGFIVLQQSCPRVWNSEELALLELVSAQVSTAIIQNQRLLKVQSLVEERTAQLQRSLEVQGKLYEKTRQQIDQLRQLNQLKDEFLDNMSDRLRHPLANMRMAIQMLRQPGLPTERQAKYLDILEQQCTQEINLVNDLLTLQQLESHQAPLNLEIIDLKPRIHDLAQSFEEKWADKGLTITMDLPPGSLLIQTDATSFERILQELLTNAGKYSDPDTTVVLKVIPQVEQQINQIVLTLTNLGPSISPLDATHIFDKFRRGEGVTQQGIHGTGLGLALVKCLVQHLNGAIALSSNPDSHSSSYETCFTLTLPQSFDHAKP